MGDSGPKKFTRRRFIQAACAAVPVALAGDAFWMEPTWLKIARPRIASVGVRILHFTDLHYKGEASYAGEVVETIHRLAPEIVCFTGDLAEGEHHLAEALALVRQIGVPVYGVPGSHDRMGDAARDRTREAFAATGGAWLSDQAV